jgi:hypothetical protein
VKKLFLYCFCASCLLLLNACISTHYKGKTLPPTKELVILYSGSEVPEGKYMTLGELEIIADTVCSSESINEKIREEGMAKGADIAVVYWFDSRFTGGHTKECTAGCSHDHDYKYKKVLKVSLLKKK